MFLMNTKNGSPELVLVYFYFLEIEQEIHDLVQYFECYSLNIGYRKTEEVEKTPRKHWQKQ